MWENLEEGKEAFHRQNNYSERNYMLIRNNVQQKEKFCTL